MHVAMHIATQNKQKETNVHGVLSHHFSIVNLDRLHLKEKIETVPKGSLPILYWNQ